MNAQAEKQRSYGQELNVEFQRKYAGLVLEIEKLNRDLNQHLLAVQQFCQEVKKIPLNCNVTIYLIHNTQQMCSITN